MSGKPPASRKLSLLLSFTLSALILAAPLPAKAQDQEQGAKSVTHTNDAPVTILPDKSKRYAVVIGIDKYTSDPNITQLRGAANDARAIAEALKKYAGFENVVLLTSDNPEPTNQPTRTVILKTLKLLKSYVERDGMLVVAYSGHGVERQSDHQSFLLPQDASSNPEDYDDTAISVSRVKGLIRESGASQVMLLLDSCRNDPTAGKGVDDDNKVTKGTLDSYSLKNSGVKAFVTLFAASEGQRAWEYQEKKQGYFSWVFVEGLKGAARDPSTGEVTLGRLIEYMQTEVPRLAKFAGKEQKPHVEMDGYGGSLVLSQVEPSVPKAVAAPIFVVPTTGTISVASTPGTQIVIEPSSGDKALVRTGTIPEDQSDFKSGPLPFGRYNITATRDGFVTQNKQVEITAANPVQPVIIPLVAATYTVTIKTNVSKGRVELGMKGEAPRIYQLQDGQAVVGNLRRGDYVVNVVPADVGFGPVSEPFTINGDLTREFKLVSRLREVPLDADFSLPEVWQVPSTWGRTRVLEVNGEGRAMLRDAKSWFADLELSANVELIGGTSVSFIVRAADEQNYYLVRLCGPHSDTPNKLRVFVVKDGQEPRHLQTFSLSSFQLSDQFLFDMKIVGDRFEFLLDDNSGSGQHVGLVPVGELIDSTLSAGSVGVAARPGDRAKLFQYLVCPGSCPKN
jgi:hypothetical protein